MNQLFYLDPESSLSLQAQIRAQLIEAILNRQIPVGVRLPSTRQLAKQLGVSRNTVIAAVQDLIAEGYLVSRERSGSFVNEEVLEQQLEQQPESPSSSDATETGQAFWSARIAKKVIYEAPYPSNWSQYPYLFIEGQFDRSLFPTAEWRECARIVQGVREIDAWAADSGDQDDALLVEQIRTKLLPARGINAAADEILVTQGAQGALALIAQLLVSPGTRVAMEDPGYRAASDLFDLHGADLRKINLDEEGLDVSKIGDSELIYTTPSHQFPTTVTMSMARRRALLDIASQDDQVIIEDDYAQETNFLSTNSPALKSLDQSGRVIYLSSLSKMLAPGLRIGYMVASRELIRRARALRRLASLQVANNNQRMAAHFLSLGHYDALSRRLNQVRKQRWLELRQAVNYCFPQPHFMITASSGGTACWIEGPGDLDARELAHRAQKRGILMDNPSTYLSEDLGSHFFRLSVTSIDVEKIRPGLEELSRLIKDMQSGFRETLKDVKGRVLTGQEIEEVMPGSALVGKTAYGDPYTVHIHEGGDIDISYDNLTRDTDTGRWWVEGNFWWRQFTRSTYGEPRGFQVVLEGDVIKWFDEAGDLVDTELFIQDFELNSEP